MKLLLYCILFITAMDTSCKEPITSDSATSLYYLIREPKVKTVNPPLLILLHGVGSNEKDLFSLAGQLPDNFLVVSARAPYKIGTDGYAWFNLEFSSGKPVIDSAQEEQSREAIINFIGQLKKEHSFNDTMVYLCGFSQGAMMSYSVGLTSPNKIRGIAILSGLLLDEVKPLIVSGDKLKHLKIFIAHGTNDNVLNINYARTSNAYLNQLGLVTVYKEYPEGHTISNAAFADFKTWLSNN